MQLPMWYNLKVNPKALQPPNLPLTHSIQSHTHLEVKVSRLTFVFIRPY